MANVPEKQSYPASVHFAFVSGILLPLAVIPYLLSRKQTAYLRHRLRETEVVVKNLHRELKVHTLQLDMMKAEQAQRASQIVQLEGKLEGLEKRSGNLHAERIQGQKALLEYVVEFEQEMDTSKLEQTKAMREVGQSLGGIAGFMHEMELRLGLESRGKDGRGIERLRTLAARLENGSNGDRR